MPGEAYTLCVQLQSRLAAVPQNKHAVVVDCNTMFTPPTDIPRLRSFVPPPSVPLVLPALTITSDAVAVDEGERVTFTITTSSPVEVDTTVHVSLAEDLGDGPGRIGRHQLSTVTIAAGQRSVSWTATTLADEVKGGDGTAVARILHGDGYTPGDQSSVSVALRDDDQSSTSAHTVDAAVITKVQALATQTRYGAAHVNRWQRVLVAFGEHDGTGVTGGAMISAEAQQKADRYSSPVWNLVVVELTALEASPSEQPKLKSLVKQTSKTKTTPELSIGAGGGITEAGAARFTISASPTPASPITVKVGVSQNGDFGASGAPTTYTVSTTNDQIDEADGSVTATLQDGTGYTVSSSNGAATVAVSDDDVPELSISAGGGITEGGAASFTITATPAPASPITVKVGISQSGDFGASGAATITISGASTTYTVSTTNNQIDEADGSVTATLQDGTGYTVSSSNGAATVDVAADAGY